MKYEMKINFGTVNRKYRRNYRQRVFVIGVFSAGLLFLISNALSGRVNVEVEDLYQVSGVKPSFRHLAEEVGINCTPRSADEFPEDLFSLEQRRHGAVVIHLMVALYLFAALGILCDDYFVSSLEFIASAMNMTPDVAGATFMAAGSSAPELFTAIIAVFVAKSDVGVGTIVGSAVFNVLCIVAICGIFARRVIQLTWWPIARDSVFYMLSVIALISVIYDKKVLWYEAVVLLLMYIIYIVIMYYNSNLEKFFNGVKTVVQYHLPSIKRTKRKTNKREENKLNPKLKEESEDKATSLDENEEDIEGSIENETEIDSDDEAVVSPKTFSRSGSKPNLAEKLEEIEDEEKFRSALTVIPDTVLGKIYWVAMIPAQVCLIITIPDCRRPGIWRRLFPITFIMSIMWIGGLTYIMVWMVVVVGDTFGIPDTVMGLTLLAAGTSVPDALAGLFVAREGYGDMAVCNAIGSNVFDILICLGLPWFLHTTAARADNVPISSHGLIYSASTLLSTVFILLIFLTLCRWRLSIKSGFLFLFLYVVIISFSCLYELNVFGAFNPPLC